MPRWNYLDLNERFFSKVLKDKEFCVSLGTYCWTWDAAIQGDGYGTLCTHNEEGKWSNYLAHRFSWFLAYGEFPEYPKYELCHKCDNTKCVNPDHLFVASHRENILDSTRKGRGYDKHGENNPKAKLTKEDVEDIRHFYKLGSN